MPTKRTPRKSNQKRRPATPAHDGYAVGMNGRRVGVAQAAVVAVLRPWLLSRFGTLHAVAARLGIDDPSTVAQFLRCAARVPESRAAAWARLGQTRKERDALHDLLVLANAHGRVLAMMRWESAVRSRATVLGTGGKPARGRSS